MSAESFYITTPIYYVNGSPHIGHAYTSIAADVAARWHRLRGRRVRMLTGLDEHGQKVLEAAQQRGLDPKTHCDELAGIWRSTMEGLDIQFDRYIRTTDPDHIALVQSALQKLWDKGEIYADNYEGWYLLSDEVFVTQKEFEERLASGASKESDFKRISEKNYFFRMGRYQQALLDHIRENPSFLQPENRRNEVLGFLKKPLGDLCISRPKTRMSWGIELPFDDDFVTYVWFDALLNYVTGAEVDVGLSNVSASWWPANVQLLGKDILTTHSVYWSTMLLAMELPLAQTLFAHGWWVSADGAKMSKSVGNTIDIPLLVDAFGVDATRYFFLREIRFGADGAFTYENFLTRTNAELANDLGNLLHRSLSMTERWLGGTVPDRPSADAALRGLATEKAHAFAEHIEALRFKEAIAQVVDLVRAGNKWIDSNEPWALHKNGQTERLEAVLRDALEVCALCGTLLSPIIPQRAQELFSKLGATHEDAQRWLDDLLSCRSALNHLVPNQSIHAGDPLFPRHREMPQSIVDAMNPPKPTEPAMSETPTIAFEDFAKVQLKVGHILKCEVHPDADKLLVATVDAGEAEPRTICAGIRSAYEPDDLVGQKVVVVTNLKPRKLRGVMSQGMLLAASGDDRLVLVSADAQPGDEVR